MSQITSVAFWYTVSLTEKVFESHKHPFALKMPRLLATCKIGRIDTLLLIPHQKMGLQMFYAM